MIDGKWQEDGLKFLGFRLTKNWEFISETRNGVKAGINKNLGVIYSNEGLRRLRALKSTGQINKYVD